MKLVLDDFINKELKEYLLTQDGIIDVEVNDIKINEDKYLNVLEIKHNEKTTSNIIMKDIELFQKNKYSILFEFDKGISGNFKILKYTIKDMCCDYCYRGLVMDLYENKKIKSVKSNYDYTMSAPITEFIIEYDETYTEEELINYINEKYK